MTVPTVVWPCATSQPPQSSVTATGQEVGDLDLREPPHPQAQGVHLRVVGVADGVVDPGPPPTTQAQRVHGARAVDRLGDDAVHHRVGGPFAQVAGRRVPEVPPRREPQQREPDDDGQGHHPAGEERRDAGDRHGDDGHEDRRDPEPGDVRQRLDVVGRARDEVAGTGALDRRQRQRDDAVHELLAQLGEEVLAHPERRPAREPRQHRLGDDRDGEADGEAVDRRDVALLGHRVDEQADDPRGGQRGRRGERVQADDEDQLAAVPQQHALGMRSHRGHLGDGQRGPRRRCHEERHQSSPRITTAR